MIQKFISLLAGLFGYKRVLKARRTVKATCKGGMVHQQEWLKFLLDRGEVRGEPLGYNLGVKLACTALTAAIKNQCIFCHHMGPTARTIKSKLIAIPQIHHDPAIVNGIQDFFQSMEDRPHGYAVTWKRKWML